MTTNAPSHSSLPNRAPLLNLLDRQVAICIELETQSAALVDRLSSDGCAEAAILIAQRQPLIDELTTLDMQFAARCPSWSAYLTTLAPADRARAINNAGRLNDLLDRVRTIDRVLSERLSEAKSGISRSLGELVKGKHSNRAYVTGTTSTTASGKNRFMDARG